MELLIRPPFTWLDALAATVVFVVFVLLAALLAEPRRQQAMAIVVAGASGVYFNGGLGPWEFGLAAAMLLCAYLGLRAYPWLAAGWLLHTVSDVLHHRYGTPIIELVPLSSAQCAWCDALIAAWLLAGAPSPYARWRRALVHPTAQ